MWQKFETSSNGAEAVAAPLLISGILLKYVWEGIEMEEELEGRVDTAASMTVIPIKVALDMKLPSYGYEDGLKSFDHSIPVRSYPKFHVHMYVPPWGWRMMNVVGCPREGVLIGRDLCKEMLLMVNWKGSGFGLRKSCLMHRPLRSIFWRLKKLKP